MYFSDSVTLRKETKTLDTFGDSAATNTDNVVFANKKSVTRAEFYSASMAGVKVDVVYEVHVEDWDNQTVLLGGTDTYEIVRSYRVGESKVELMCRRRA